MLDSSTGNVLKIDKSVIYKFKIEKETEFTGSFFHDVYKQAENLLNDIIKPTNNKENRKGKEDKAYTKVDNDFNNIIAFIGERGSGKTSSMISFSESLRGETSYNAEFHLLDMIDPSVFDNKRDSIVEIIVATMFKNFKKKLKNNGETGSYNSNKLDLVKQFEEVYKDLKIINSEKENIFHENAEELESLVNLASAIDMKKDLRELVKSYLQYMTKKDNTFLVICIDDLDMNISSGEKMIEEIRKYLVTPQVVILMAIRFPQLEMLVKQKNINELNTLVEYAEKIDKTKPEKQNENFKDIEAELENKTDKYLEKIIPYNKRIFMPEINVNDVKIKVNLGNINKNIKMDDIKPIAIAPYMAKLYYDYLRYIIVTQTHYNVVVPNTLRELVELIRMFSDMQVVSEENEKKAVIKNIELAKNYFSSTLIHKTNDLGMKKLLKEVIEAPLISINKTILLFLNRYLNRRNNNIKLIDKYVTELYSNEAYILEKSVNFGEIITWIKECEGKNIFANEKEFIEIVKMIYSLRLIQALYSSDTELLYVIEKDIVGRYFEISDTRHWKDIDNEKMSDIKIADNTAEKDVELLYQLLEPNYILQKKGLNLSKLYRNHVYTVRNKIEELQSFTFKPFNILGISNTFYHDGFDKDDKGMISSKAEDLDINQQEYLLIFNLDFYMELLSKIDNLSRNKRINEGTTIEKEIKIAYETIDESLKNICKEYKGILDVTIILDLYLKKVEIAMETMEKLFNKYALQYSNGQLSEVKQEKQKESFADIRGSITVVRPRKVINQLPNINQKLLELKEYINKRYDKYIEPNANKKMVLSRFSEKIERDIETIKKINIKFANQYANDFSNLHGVLLQFIKDDVTREEVDLIAIEANEIINSIIENLNSKNNASEN